MIDEKLLKYVKDTLSAGASVDKTRQDLLDQGWSNNEIDEAISLAKGNNPPVSEIKKGGFPTWLIIALVVIVVGAGIFGYLTFRNQDEPPEDKLLGEDLLEDSDSNVEAINCEADFDCFVTASESCKPATVTYAVSKDIASGVGQTVSAFFEIKGEENGKCVLYGETEEIGLTFPEGVPQEAIDQISEPYNELKNESKTQEFEMGDLAILLEKLESQDFSIFSLRYLLSSERIIGDTIDCGTDFDCFIAASQLCELATVDKTTVINMFGVEHKNVVLFEIKGEEDGKCVLYEEQKENKLTFSPEVPQETVDEQQAMYDSLEGMNGTCKFNKAEDLVSIMKNYKIGSMSTKDFDVAECSGEMFNQ